MQTYAEAKEFAKGRARKLANNTYLETCPNGPQGPDGDPSWYGVRLHSTVVLRWDREGNVILNTGGWYTVTTKDRINRYLPRGWSVYSNGGIWYLGGPEASYAFADGITLHPDGTVTGGGEDPKRLARLRKQARKFAADYMEAFAKGKVPAPSAGDCWGCCMRAEDGSYPLGKGGEHLRQHFEERYYVPSLLARAVERFPVSQVAQHALAVAWNPEAKANGYDPQNPCEGYMGEIAKEQLRSSLRRFCYEQLGTGS